MAEKYNKDHLEPRGEPLVRLDGSDRDIWNDMRDKMGNSCKDEICWVDHVFGNGSGAGKTIKEKTFRPEDPGHGTMLKTSNIGKSMRQYEAVYPNFMFLGPCPIDMLDGFSNLDLKELNGNGVDAIGIIVNLDPSDREGSHWVALFIDLRGANPVIEYFDSYGLCPPARPIGEFMAKMKGKFKYELGGGDSKEILMKCNSRHHQFASKECGVYSMYFILCRLKGATFERINRQIISDEEMIHQRKVFFRPRGT